MSPELMAFALVTVLRLTGSFAILRQPFWGYVLAMFLDALDLQILESLQRILNYEIDYLAYQLWDKAADLQMLFMAFGKVLSWQEPLARKTGTWLFGYRMIGALLFFATTNSVFLIIFSNFFELFYLFYVYAVQNKPGYKIKTAARLAAVLSVVFMLQLSREFYIHIFDGGVWQNLKSIFRTN